LYTRGGDKGETGLYGAKRVPKDSVRVEAYGTVDELNSGIGVAIAHSSHERISEELKRVQGLLFVAGADLASELPADGVTDRVPRISKANTDRLEKVIDELQLALPRLTNFILPGGGVLSAHLHLARSICRRAERKVVALSKAEKVNPELIPFLNRLSTLLFNLARYANVLEETDDEVWSGR
jgi:cob(I)alamin adenosyltransferase